VLGQSYRNPGLLAHMARTLQLVTEGRFVLGIGAGWHAEEYHALGYEFPSPSVRVQQLAEAIQVLRAMWTESPATFVGEYYRVDGAVSERPDPPIPIMVGTNGPRALEVVARHADWWNWDGPWEPTYRVPHERLRQHCDAIGRDFDEIGLTAGATIDMPRDASSFVASYEHTFYPGQTFPIMGPSPDDVRRELQTLIDVGVQHLQLAFEDMQTYERFVEAVLPNLDL
jgi:alkanesulfonate monooxygenase SsuD/methylene tetrahydromethanopterin reductase-like flavin-dependent oxidoreductase (luciferase family)